MCFVNVLLLNGKSAFVSVLGLYFTLLVFNLSKFLTPLRSPFILTRPSTLKKFWDIFQTPTYSDPPFILPIRVNVNKVKVLGGNFSLHKNTQIISKVCFDKLSQDPTYINQPSCQVSLIYTYINQPSCQVPLRLFINILYFRFIVNYTVITLDIEDEIKSEHSTGDGINPDHSTGQ